MEEWSPLVLALEPTTLVMSGLELSTSSVLMSLAGDGEEQEEGEEDAGDSWWWWWVKLLAMEGNVEGTGAGGPLANTTGTVGGGIKF